MSHWFKKPLHAFKNPAYIQSSVTLLLFFASWGVWWSVFEIWLTSSEQGLALSGDEVGKIYSVNSLVTLILMFFYGALQDRLVLKRNLLIFCAVIASMIDPFFVWVYAPLLKSLFLLGIIAGAIVFSSAFIAAAGVFEAVAERFSRQFEFQYGWARSWGSFGYALAALLAGFLFAINPYLNFWVGSLFGILLLLNLIFWKPKAERALSLEQTHQVNTDIPSLREMIQLLKLKELWVIIVFIMFSWTFYTVYDQQMFPGFYARLFSTEAKGTQIYGVLNSIQVYLEALMMCLTPFLMLKIGVRNTLLIGVGIMAVRIGLSAFFSDPIIISLVKLLHGFEVPLFILSIFRYFTLHFAAKFSATIYMIGFQAAAKAGESILSYPLGLLRDKIGYSQTFLVIAVIVIIAGCFAFFALKKDDEDVHGDPFIRS